MARNDLDSVEFIDGVGDPLQEPVAEPARVRSLPRRWLLLAGAAVLLAFGASADFLAGNVQRAPELVRRFGMEWGYRLAREPRRLSRRYVLEGPTAAVVMARNSFLAPRW